MASKSIPGGVPLKKLIAVLACVACACLPAPALAATHTEDAAATRAYLHAAAAYRRGTYAEVGTIVAAINARAGEIAGECPAALTYAPRDTAFGALGAEAVMTTLLAGLAPVRSVLLRLSGTIARLTWSDRRLTRLVHAQAAEEGGIVALALPDVCADIAAWEAGAYAALPQNVARFFARLQAIESSSSVGPSEESREAVIARLLRPYERPAERRVAKRIARLKAQFGRRLTAATVAAAAQLATGLGVSAL